MALKPCRECGKEVSTGAPKCPHCGAKSPTESALSHGLKGILSGLVLIGLGVWIWSAISSPGDAPPPPPPEAQAQQDASAAKIELSGVHPISSDDIRYITGYATNNSASPYSMVMVSFNLFDAQGDQVGTAEDATNNLAAGQRWRFKALITSDSAKTYKLAQISAY